MCSDSHRGSRCLSAHFTLSKCHPWCHMFERAFVVSSCSSLSCFSPSSTFSLSQSTCSLSDTPSSMSSPPRVKHHCTHAQWGVLVCGDIQSSHKRPIETASIWSKSLGRVYSLNMCCPRGEIWKGDILVADIEELEQMDAWNPETNCTCRPKNHSLSHWNTITSPETLIHHWMQRWRKV